jgi:hypothetical protein
MAKKLKLSRETLRALAPKELSQAHGALRDTRSCQYCVTMYTCSCVNSVCNSCYDTDCCLADTETMCVAG